MGLIQYEVPNNVQRMTIGVQGEANVREFLFDVTEWRQITGGIGSAEMVVQRNGDSSPYAAMITMHDANTVSWVPTAADTEKAGAGKLQLMWMADGQTVKTKIFDMKVDPALDYQLPDDSLDPWASWIPDVINAASKVQELPSIVADLETQVQTESAARTEADTLLNARIDGIIAPTGEAPSVEEVLDARTGVDGTNYASLGAAVRGQITDLKSAFRTVEESKYINDWKQGTLAVDGTLSDSAKRCRIEDFIQFDPGVIAIMLHIPNGKKITYREYGSASEGSFIFASVWLTTDTEIQINAGHYYRFAIAYTGDTAIVPGDIARNSVAYDNAMLVDRTLSKGGKAADAEAVGTALKSVIRNEFGSYFITTEAEHGTINSDSGANTTDTHKRIRSHGYIKMCAGDVIQFSDITNVKSFIGAYSFDGTTYTYIGALKLLSETSVTAITIEKDCYIRYAIGYIDERNIEPSLDSFAALLNTIKTVRKTGYKKEYVDTFEPGSLSNTMTRGILYNTKNYSRHRSSNMYNVKGVNEIQATFDQDDVENISKINIILYDETFENAAIIDGTLSGNTFGGFVGNWRYACFLVYHESDVYQFKNVVISADGEFKTQLLPSVGNEDTAYNSIAYNYEVQSGVLASGRLMLPPNYTMTGAKVPLIVFAHGSNSMLNWGASMPVNYLDYFKYLCNEGFAVFDCYPWTTKANRVDSDTYSPIMIPLNLRAYIEGIKYTCRRFNVDINNVSLLCKSQGGNIGHWAYMQTEFPFRAVGLFAPTTDPVLQKTQAVFYNSACRQSILNSTALDGTEEEKSEFVSSGLLTNENVASFLAKNKGKIVSMMPFAKGIQGSVSSDELFRGGLETLDTVPEWMREEGLPERQSAYDLIPNFAANADYAKFAQCPVKFWCAFDDASTSTYGNYAIHRYLLNGGSDSEFRVLPLGTGGHHAMDTDTNALKSSGTTALGIEYTDIPTAYVEFAQFVSQYVR